MNTTVNIARSTIIDMVIDFVGKNWVNLLLILVGASALIIYILQERRKETEAASLLILQIDELQDKIIVMRSFIENGQLNETAFYESLTLFGEDYWNRYKHYFVKKIDTKSYRTLNSLYDYASEIQEQQQLMKNLQKNSFFVTQQVLANLETNYIISGLNNSTSFPVDVQQLVSGLSQSVPSNIESAQKTAIENMLRQVALSNSNIDFETFWKNYNQNRSNIRTIIDQNGLTKYIPVQIRLSLEKALNQYALLEVSSCEGYKTIKNISKRKF